MTDWKQKLEVGRIIREYENKAITFEVAKKSIIEELKKARVQGYPDEWKEMLVDMGEAENEDEFDRTLDHAYDIADYERIWLGAM